VDLGNQPDRCIVHKLTLTNQDDFFLKILRNALDRILCGPLYFEDFPSATLYWPNYAQSPILLSRSSIKKLNHIPSPVGS
jgi:hypothetical protein